jgi:hypothetical protein
VTRRCGGLQAYEDSRPIATLDAGKGRVMQFSDTKFALYPDRVKTPKGTHPLTPAVHAEVEFAGGYRKKVDKRELYLTIEGEGWSITHQCERRRGEKVRSFASAVNAAVLALPAVQRAQSVVEPVPSGTISSDAAARPPAVGRDPRHDRAQVDLLGRVAGRGVASTCTDHPASRGEICGASTVRTM